MAHIAKHDAEQEGKRDNGEQGRIDLAIRGNAVRVDQRLEAAREFVGSEVGRRRHCRPDAL